MGDPGRGAATYRRSDGRSRQPLHPECLGSVGQDSGLSRKSDRPESCPTEARNYRFTRMSLKYQTLFGSCAWRAMAPPSAANFRPSRSLVRFTSGGSV